MGVDNYCELLKKFREPVQEFGEPTDKPATSFDSVLFDAQTFLNKAIEEAIENNESDFKVCDIAWKLFYRELTTLLSFVTNQTSLTVVVSLDGKVVPLKGQRKTFQTTEDRLHLDSFENKTSFEENFVDRLKRIRNIGSLNELKFIVCGCRVPGEGKLKIFEIAEQLSLRNPIVYSIDQDVFVIAIARKSDFENVHVYLYDEFYNVYTLVGNVLTDERITSIEEIYDIFLYVSFLFGNDFVPPLIPITENNAGDVFGTILVLSWKEPNCNCRKETCQECIYWESKNPTCDCMNCQECIEYLLKTEDEVVYLSRFIRIMDIDFTKVEHVDENLVVSFWMTLLWISLYYRNRHFPQKYMLNTLYDSFDRNQLLTALTDEEFSGKMLSEARRRLKNAAVDREQTIPNDKEAVKRFDPNWTSKLDGETRCKVVKLNKP